MFGHIENSEPDEVWLFDLAHRCIQLDTDQILGIHVGSGDHIVPMLLNNCLAFIPFGGKLHFHSFLFKLHKYAIGGICQQLAHVLLHSGIGLGSFLTQHAHIFEYKWNVSEGCVCQTL